MGGGRRGWQVGRGLSTRCEKRSSPIFVCRAGRRTLLTAGVMDGEGECMVCEQ